YDPLRARVVLFGGATTSDTWEWDGTTWAQASASTTTAWSANDLLTFDASRGAVVRWSPASPQDAYLWNGSAWAGIGSGASPSFTQGASLGFDSVRKVPLLVGTRQVQNPGYALVTETWELAAAGWQLRWATDAPGGDAPHDLVYDPATKEVQLICE